MVSNGVGHTTLSAPSGENGALRDKPIPLNDVPAYTPRKLRIVTIGAGFSGLTLAHKFQYQHPELHGIIDHTIYEARSELGGTWLVNTYPGVVCDVPAHIYVGQAQEHFRGGQEILAYIQRTAQKWDLERDVKYGHRVTAAHWQEDGGQWKITVEHNGERFEDYANVLISAQGFLNTWDWPSIPGLDNFQGKKVHTASWDHDYDYSNKRIAVIGNGSSGIQVLPQMAKLERTHCTSFQRGPTWVVNTLSSASLLGGQDTAYNPAYTEEEKRRFRCEPKRHHEYRKTIIGSINNGFKMFIKGSPEWMQVQELAQAQMKEKLGHDPVLCEKLIPEWEVGCRRITPGEGYLESFLLPNVDLCQSAITQITSSGVETADGKFYEVDVVVCATGFNVSYRPQFPIIGRDAVNLGDKWADDPRSYLSLAVADMPNYFMFTGPNALIGHGSLVESLGWSAEYMIKWIMKIAHENLRDVVPKERAVEEFVTYSDQVQKTLTWTGQCRSWYKNHTVDGRVTATFAGSALLFKQLIKDLRPEDFDITPRGVNRFQFIGNGFMAYEWEKGRDLAWYVQK